MIVAVLSIDIHIPGGFSLKDKRMVLNRIRDRVRNKFSVSIAEIDYHDKWQRSLIGIAMVTSQRGHAEEVMTKIFQFLDSDDHYEIIKYSIEYK